MAAKDDLVSGTLINGTSNVTELAERLASTFWRGGHCAIAIANDTGHTLMAPQRYTFAGSVNSMPMTIESGKTGLISAVKTFGSPLGTQGVLTYEISTDDINNVPLHTRLQLMWTAPFYVSLADNKVNVSIGTMSANEDLYDRMTKEYHGQLIRAKDTSFLYIMDFGFEANVYMGEKGPAPLAITLTRNKTFSDLVKNGIHEVY